MPLNHPSVGNEALHEFQQLRCGVEVPVATRRFWDRILTAEQRRKLGGFEAAFASTGPIGVWLELRRISAERAVVELALRLGLTDQASADWILLELGEAEVAREFSDTPLWNKETGELVFRGQVARQVPRPEQAFNIVAVLDAFQELGWPPTIDDPLPGGRNKKRLERTREVLNTGCKLIRFHVDGNSKRLSWSVQ